MKLKFSLFVLTSVFLVITSCKKYEAGPKGDTGAAGTAGNLVTKQFSITLDSSSWSKNEFVWENEIFTEFITPTVIQKGEVKVYLSVDNQWWVLPYGKDYIFTQASMELGKIKLLNEHIHGGVPNRPETNQYRVVVMTPAD